MKSPSFLLVVLCTVFSSLTARADDHVRIRWGVEAGGHNTVITARPFPMAWGGQVGAQIGVQFNDTFGATVRPRFLLAGGDVSLVTLSTIVSFDLALSDQLEIGVGAGYDYWLGNWRADIAFNGGSMFAAEAHVAYRIAGDRRNGLILALTPHVALYGSDAFITTQLSLGYASF